MIITVCMAYLITFVTPISSHMHPLHPHLSRINQQRSNWKEEHRHRLTIFFLDPGVSESKSITVQSQRCFIRFADMQRDVWCSIDRSHRVLCRIYWDQRDVDHYDGHSRDCIINLFAKPRRRYDRNTDIDVTWQWGTSSSPASSFL